jgi:hypothetical protein
MLNFQKDQYAAGFKVLNEFGAPVPVGEYTAIISEMADETKREDANVHFIKTVFTIDEGDFVNRKVFTRFYYQNEIGLGRFLALAKAAGAVISESSTSVDDKALLGKKVIIVIKSSLNKKTGESRPEFSYAKPVADVPFA